MPKAHGYCAGNIEHQIEVDIKKIYKVFYLCGSFMLLEIWGHWTSNTISLLADSIHLFVDLLSFIISLLALRWTKKKPDDKMTFGYGRVEILGAMFSIFLIWIAVAYLILESYHRYKYPHKIDERIFLAISIVGFFVNIVCLFFLHERHHHNEVHEKKNLNVRATYVHIIGDTIQSIGVVIAGIVTYIYPKFVLADIICTIFFSILVLITTFLVLKDGIQILLERTPVGINLVDIKTKIKDLEHVCDVLEVHAWSISANIAAINAKILLEDTYMKEYENTLKKSKKILKEVFKFDLVFIQIETFKTYYDNQIRLEPLNGEALLEEKL